MSDGEVSTEPLEPTTSAFTRVLAIAGRVIAPTALVTAVLYYFGWARTEAAADRAGTDQSLFGYSTSDYVLRSVGPLYRPIGIALLLAAVLIISAGAAREWLRVRVERGQLSRRRLAAVTVVAVGMSVLALVLGAPGLNDVKTQDPAHVS